MLFLQINPIHNRYHKSIGVPTIYNPSNNKNKLRLILYVYIGSFFDYNYQLSGIQ